MIKVNNYTIKTITFILLYYVSFTFGKDIINNDNVHYNLFPNNNGVGPNDPPVGTYGPETMITGSDDIERIHNVTVPTITPFLVSNSSSHSAVIIAPGGGYSILAWNIEGVLIAKKFNEFGMNCFVLKYRVPARPPRDDMPKWWAPLQDAQRAVSWVRSNSDKYNLNASRIGFMGFSAGGHLTAHISTAWKTRIYTKIDSIDDVSMRPDFSLLIYPWTIIEDNKASSTTMAKEIQIDKDTPQAFLAAAEDDATAPYQNSIQYFTHLSTNAGVKMNRIGIYPDGGHGFNICFHRKTYHEVCDWPNKAKVWLKNLGYI